MELRLKVDVLTQPDDCTCGPTCLQGVYAYLGDAISLEQVIAETRRLEDGGTLAVLLGCHALSRGYRASIHTYNLQVFDPTWFVAGVDLIAKLKAQAAVKAAPKLQAATEAYIEFLEQGGRLRFEDLTPAVIRRYLNRGVPILTGLSATYLYRSKRELTVDGRLEFDDVKGVPMGHFVVLCGYHRAERCVLVAAPWGPHPSPGSRQYWVGIDRLINSILLGIITYDANLLVIEPSRGKAADEGAHRRQ